MTKSIKSVIALTLICLIMAIALAAVNYATAPVIEEAEATAAKQALAEVHPEAGSFEMIDLSAFAELPATVTEAYRADVGGYVVKLTTKGYSRGLVIMCGISGKGEVLGCKCIASGETLGYEKTYGENLVGKSLEDIGEVDTVSNATLTTAAYKNAVRDALTAADIFSGKSENAKISQALPAAEGKFTAWFMTEELADIVGVHIADNGAGYVLVARAAEGLDEYIGADPEGNALTDTELDTVSLINKIKGASQTKLDESLYSSYQSITAVYKTSGGNYVFELSANGYGTSEGYHASGKPIKIKLSVTADGKIIDCLTEEQYETENLGSECASADFYKQFLGLTKDTVDTVDGISGATVTTNGYISAIKTAFDALAEIKGGGN